MPHVNQEMEQCIAACTDCHHVCVETVTHCLEKGGAHADAAHIRTLLDCAQICQTAGDFLLRGSELHGRTCAACAEVCERCAESCDRLGDDAEMRRCAAECRRCAEECRRMAA